MITCPSLPAAVKELESRVENVWFEEVSREVTADVELRPVGKRLLWFNLHVVPEGLDVDLLYDAGECENIGLEENRRLPVGPELYVEL
jgi:hypothetical protein